MRFLIIFPLLVIVLVTANEGEANVKHANDAVAAPICVGSSEESLTPLQKASSESHGIEMMLIGKAAYFRPSSNKFRKIYGGGWIYDMELKIQTYKQLYTWTSIGLFTKSGVTSGGRDRTKIQIVPIGVGLQYLYPLGYHNDAVYFGAGVLPTYVHVYDQPSFLVSSSHKWGYGGVFKTGAILYLCHSIFVDFFANYTILWISGDDSTTPLVFGTKANLCGLSVGGGIGYRF